MPDIRMSRAACCLVLLAIATPARAADLPFFAGGDGRWTFDSPPPLAFKEAPAQASPWSGLTFGTEVFGAAGAGRGGRGGFGGDAFVGYYKEFDNRIVIGAQGSAGYMPGLYNYGPRSYSYGLAQVRVGYDMGRLLPYVTFGAGLARPSGWLNGAAVGLDSLNDMFVGSGPSTTITTVGAGVEYAVTNNLTIGVEVDAVQQRSAFGPPLIPQPGMP
ncbi:MAG TPA: outer membrane beta-barrel protein [Rhodoblastus sp.]|nr:outer membrane beta-barrel protein [Rhodoblastus sp.]